MDFFALGKKLLLTVKDHSTLIATVIASMRVALFVFTNTVATLTLLLIRFTERGSRASLPVVATKMSAIEMVNNSSSTNKNDKFFFLPL